MSNWYTIEYTPNDFDVMIETWPRTRFDFSENEMNKVIGVLDSRILANKTFNYKEKLYNYMLDTTPEQRIKDFDMIPYYNKISNIDINTKFENYVKEIGRQTDCKCVEPKEGMDPLFMKRVEKLVENFYQSPYKKYMEYYAMYMNLETYMEKHIPTYNYCGPGTHVIARVFLGDKPINELDAACQVHDIEYFIYAGQNDKLIESDKKLRKVTENFPSVSSTVVDLVFKIKNIVDEYIVYIPIPNPVSDATAHKIGKFLIKYIQKDFDRKQFLIDFYITMHY